MMPAGLLLCTDVCLSVIWLVFAHCCIELTSCPVRVGSDRPATISIVTGLVCGHEVPAACMDPATELSTTVPVTPTGLGAGLTVSPSARSVAAASVNDFAPVTGGTVIMRGPRETVTAIVAPGSARPDGEMDTTSPLGTSLSISDVSRMWNPAWASAWLADAAGIRATAGSALYRPDVSHHPQGQGRAGPRRRPPGAGDAC